MQSNCLEYEEQKRVDEQGGRVVAKSKKKREEELREQGGKVVA